MKLINIFITLAFLVLSSCGYKAVNNSENYNFQLKNIEIIGDKNINLYLDRNFKKFQNNNSTKIFDIKLKSEINKTVTSKNSAGKDTSFSLEIVVDLKIFEKEELLENINFRKNISYNNLDSQFELKQYENVLIKDLTDQIIFDMNNFISSLK